MKRIIYSLTAVLALVACSKEQESLDYELFDGEVSTIIAKFNPVTKTTVELAGDQAAYTWEESETISVFNGSTALTYTVVDRNAGTFQYAGDPAGELAYAVSPADALSSPSAGSYELTIESNYTGYKSNVSNAIMVAGAPSDVIDGKPVFAFQHAAALMRFTYENVPVGTTGLKFSTDKKINGTFTVSGSTPELTLANAPGTTETKLTLASAVSSANTSIIFYVPIPTGNYSTFTVTLFNGEGDIASTTKTMNASFTATKGHVINTPVITLDRVGASYYQKITSTGDLSDGDYLIVYETGSVAFNGGLATLDASSNTIDVVISDNRISSNATTNASVFTYNSTDQTLQSKSGYYIGKAASGNGLNANKTTQYVNTITFSDGNAIITSSGGPVLKYNKASDQKRFRYYGSGQEPIQLYKKVTDASGSQLSIPQNLKVDANSKKVSWHSVKDADSYTLTIDGTEHTGITETYFISDIADGNYDVSLQAISADHSVKLDSEIAYLYDAKFGTPTLVAPSITSVEQTATGFTSEWTAGDKYTTSYDWEFREGSTSGTILGSGSTSGISLVVPFASLSIDEYVSGTSYYLVVKAKADGYIASASTSSYFTATSAITVSIKSFDSISGSLDSNIIYEAIKDNGTADPTVRPDGSLRIYKPASGKSTGSKVTITADNGKKIKELLVGASNSGSIKYKIDSGSLSSAFSISSSNSLELTSISASSIIFYNTGSGSIDINEISVVYE